MSHVGTIARFALRESLRRRVFVIVGVLTVGFLVLYGLGTWQAFKSADTVAFNGPVEGEVVVGATLLGLAAFGTLFLGAVLAVFLTLGAVRGDADRGLLQPVLVRGVSRSSYLLGRWIGAAVVCAIYVVVVFLGAAVITWAFGGWWPDRVVQPSLALASAVALIAAMSVAASVVLGMAANGIAVFMVFGAGLVAGLLGQIAEAIQSGTLETVSDIASWLLPFEALYQGGLAALTADTVGFTRFAIDLGPFGGAQRTGPLLWLWAVVYLAGIGAAARVAFARRDL